jgi:mRNA-degrading endonuclease RelE of RelBE toxin-antitoxin system
MTWKIIIPTKLGKKILKLPKSVQAAVLFLARDLE